MSVDLETPAPVAGDEVVAGDAVSVDTTEGQDESQPAEATTEAEETEKSRSKDRRERRKAELDTLRQGAADAERAIAQANARTQRMQEAAAALPNPKQSDYPTYEEYQAALTAFHTLKATDARDLRMLQDEARQHYDRAAAVRQAKQTADALNWDAQAAEARTRYPDFDAVALGPAPISVPMAEVIRESDVGAELAYFIAKNPALCAEIASMPPVQMARAMGRLEAQLSAPKPKTVSTAPDPITPVSPKATASRDPASMSPNEFAAWRAKGGTFKL